MSILQNYYIYVVNIISVIREKVKESCSSSSTSSNNISLKNTRGPPTRLEVSPKKKPDKGISIDDLKNWMKKEGMCLAHLRRNGKLIRKHFGKKSIEKYAREALKQESHSMDKFFETKEFIFEELVKIDVKGKVKKEKRYFKRWVLLLISTS